MWFGWDNWYEVKHYPVIVDIIPMATGTFFACAALHHAAVW